MEFYDLLGFVDGGVILPAVIVGLRQHGVKERVDGVEVEGLPSFGEGFGIAPFHDQQMTIPLVGRGIVCVKLNRASQFPLGGGQIPVIAHGHVAEDGVSFGKAGIELQGALGEFPCLGLGLARGDAVVGRLAENGGGLGEASVGLRVRRIVVNGLLKKYDAAAQVAAAAPSKLTLMVGEAGVGNLMGV